MINKISVKTELGWISAFENEGKIFKIKFGKEKKQFQSKILINYKKNLLKFFSKNKQYIKAPYTIEGDKIQQAKQACKNLGFDPGTEAFAECSLKKLKEQSQ